jgi:hypothetical protein
MEGRRSIGLTGASSRGGIHGEAPLPEVRLQLGQAERLLGLEAAGAIAAAARRIQQGLRPDERRGRRDTVVARAGDGARREVRPLASPAR